MSEALLDTNVISELARAKPDPRIVAFLAQQEAPFISALTLHELTYGAERAPDPRRRAKLIAWVTMIRTEFRGRIVAIDESICEHAGRLRAAAEAKGSPVDPIDALIAASAAAHAAVVATRNVRDFAALGVPVINPWD